MSEIESIERLHRSAQARIGLAVAFFSRDRWSSVQASRPDAGSERWASQVADAVVEARELSAALSRSYYRLARAIEIGITMGEEREELTIGLLRDLFVQQVVAVASIGEDSEASPFHALYTSDTAEGALEQIDIMPDLQRMLDESKTPDTRRVTVDPYAWPPVASGDEILERIKRTLKAEAVDPLKADLAKFSRSEENDPKRALQKIEEAHAKKGSLGAGKADQFVMRAGRAVLDHAHGSDRRVLMFARCTSSNPCYFCAMLASRGFVYASASSASRTDNASKTNTGGHFRSYHAHCKCFPIARWVQASPLPANNTYFQKLWNTEIQGKYSGDAAIRAWRKLIARKRREGTIPTT